MSLEDAILGQPVAAQLARRPEKLTVTGKADGTISVLVDDVEMTGVAGFSYASASLASTFGTLAGASAMGRAEDQYVAIWVAVPAAGYTLVEEPR